MRVSITPLEFRFLLRVARQFCTVSDFCICPLGKGLINDTFLVSGAHARFVLQRINQRVFPDCRAIMENIKVFTEYAHNGTLTTVTYPFLRFPKIIPTQSGEDFFIDETGGFWRALTFIEKTKSLDAIKNVRQALQVGRVLGQFHALTRNLPPDALHDTLPNFHNAPHYLMAFDKAVAQRTGHYHPAILQDAITFVENRRAHIGILENAKQRGDLPIRVTHGDPKLDNILFDEITGHGVSLIDLDTVKPGLTHYDIGDCLRSCSHRSAYFNLEWCRAILEGYCMETVSFLSESDPYYLYEAIRLLPFELGLRFLTDHLTGDTYFKVSVPGENLQRAVSQFQLTESIEAQQDAILLTLSDIAHKTLSSGYYPR